MQLLHAHNAITVTVKEMNMSMMGAGMQQASSDDFEVKKSSSASLRPMNPVASGDNMAVMNSAHKLKEELPPLVPCCEGKELQISEDLVRSGLSAISVRHDGVMQSISMSQACERMQVPPGLVKHRNSFRALHRPDLKHVPYLRRLTPEELETLFQGYTADLAALGNSKHEDQDMVPLEDNSAARPDKKNDVHMLYDGNAGNGLDPIPESRAAADVPAGMRLHGARARLYTSVLAGVRAGDQLDGMSSNEECDTLVPDELLPEDEVQLKEQLQIILPPRCDDVTAESSTTNKSTVS